MTKRKRVLSGLMAIITILSALLQPASALADDPESEAYEAEYPALESVRQELAEDEIVTAGDYEIEAGSGFDVEHDFIWPTSRRLPTRISACQRPA